MKNKIIAGGVILTILAMQTIPVFGVSKDETVYTKIKNNGEIYQTIVNSHLKNMEKLEELEDTSILKDIENLNGNEEFTQNGNKMVWKANQKDIYYQGKTDKEMPIKCEITYKLDGEEILADEIAGKSGKVEITVKYENKDEHEVQINGKTEKMYTPFVVVLGTVIDNTKASNISVSSGKIIDNGKNTIVAGIALPGMQENLGINKEDIEIPDSFTITLDATEFEMENMYSYITPKIFEDSDIENLDKLDEIYDQMNTLKSASTQIVKGATSLNEGANTLNDKTNEFSEAVKTYTDGVNTVNENYEKIDNGIQTLDNSVNILKNGAGSINKGVTELSTGITSLNQGVKSGKNQAEQTLTTSKKNLIQGIDLLIQGKDQETAGIEQVVKQGNSSLGTGIKTGIQTSINQNLSSVNTAIKQVLENEKLEFTDAQKQAIGQVLAKLDTTAINNQISSQIDAAVQTATNKEIETIEGINNSKDGIKENLKTMKKQSESQFDQGIAAISHGFDQITEGTNTLQSAVDTKLAPGANQLYSGTESLKQGSSTLKSGSTQIKNGVQTLSNSGAELSKASTMLSEGTTELAKGSNNLKEGAEKFDKEGISKIADFINSNVKDLQERVEKMQELANEYNNFSGIEDDDEGSVKFIMMSDKIGKKEE